LGKLEGKRTLGRPRLKCVDNIRISFCFMDLGEIEWGDMDWIGLEKDSDQWRAPVNAVMNLRVQ
jgi:hypothetical protein